MDKPKSTEFTLEATSELRIETSAKCTIQLKVGFAEIFGTELSRNKEYTFTNGGKFAVFTWHGCTLLMTGNTEDAYVSVETPMLLYVNIHTALEQMRCKAEKNNEFRGPRVMIVGPDDVGKTTLCKMLLNWAVRVGRSPIFVDLDVSQNAISLPGTISALVVERTSQIEEGYNLDSQLAFHYGYKTPNENPVLYKTLISILTDRINLRSEKIHATLVSGLIINTSGWIRDEGYAAIRHAATEFDVNMILVIDQERLRVDLIRDLPETIKILSIPKSGGVVIKSQEIRTQFKTSKMREYFYGFKSNLYPHNIEVKFNDVTVYKVGAPQMSEGLLPMGMNTEENYTKIYKIQPSYGLLHHILAVIHAQDDDEEEDKSGFLEANVAGYLVVTKIDTDKGSMMVLCPQSRLPPKSVLLVSDVQFVDFT